MNILSEFDGSKYKLGSLCKRGHNWDGQGHSLRYLTGGACVECKRKIEEARLRSRGIEPRPTPKYEILLDILRNTEFEDKCVEWEFCKSTARYGQVVRYKEKHAKKHLVHRIALEHKLGRPIKPGLHSCHHCDNPPCFNPNHLFEGTHLENMQDMHRKGKKPACRGEKHRDAKLSNLKVQEVRQLRSEGVSVIAIAKRMGVNRNSIYSILNRVSWTHVD